MLSNAAATNAELQRAFQLQRAAARADPFPLEALRADRLRRLIDLLVTHARTVCEAVENDFGRRSADNTQLFDILPPLNALKYALAELPTWMRGVRRRSNFPFNWIGAKSSVQHVPLGVVGNITPWNFPVTLALSPMGGVLAAGNRVMLKPSELTPNTSAALKTLIGQYFAEDEIYVALGDAEVAGAFAALPFDHLLFTGSTQVGRLVAQAAAANLVPVTLELGGKSPVIVGRSADLEEVAAKVLFAKTTNAGQICLAPDYVLIEPSRRAGLVTKMQRIAAQLYPGGLASKDYVNIISERHALRLRRHLSDAAACGNPVIPLFEPEAAPAAGTANVRRVAPHVVLIGERGGSLMEEEIFGPVLPIVGAEGFTQALDYLAARPAPLALYYFGSDAEEIDRVSRHAACGGLVINDAMTHFLQDDLPFGGVGESGMGSYHGYEGFQRFSHAKAIFKQSRLLDIGRMLRPPFGPKTQRLLKMQLKK